MVSVPGLLPGDRVAPLATATLPATVPVPASVPPLLTCTLPATEPFTASVPALMVVPPV
ncbi:hypothetical protein D3C85_1833000 [compost metagenome]